MKTVVYPSDRGGCGNYRLRWPGQVLAAQGYEVKVSERMPQVVMNGDHVVDVFENGADVVVFQRPCRPQIVEALKIMQDQGKRVVIDMDDLLSEIHPHNSAYAAYNYLDPNKMHWRFGDQACELADVVTCTTPELAEYYGGVVVPNAIPSWYLNVENKPKDLVTVGYAGFVGTHPNDLRITHGALSQALSATKGSSRFLALGDQKTLEALGIRDREPNGWVEGVNMSKYPEFLAQLDIGIVPLEDSKFNQAKSWLKALEYASVGVVPVVSPTYDNMRMVDAGAAIVASNPREWSLSIEGLIKDDERRQELASKAREFASQWTLEGNAHRWADAWGLS